MIHVPAWSPLVTVADVSRFGEAGVCFGCGQRVGSSHAATGTVECWRLRHRRDKRHSWIAYLHLKAKDERIEHGTAAAIIEERDTLIDELREAMEWERPTMIAWLDHHREHTLGEAA